MSLHPPTANLVLAAESYRRGRLDEAASYCRRALKKQPGRFDALQLLFGVHFAKGNLPEALTAIRHAVKADPAAPPKPPTVRCGKTTASTAPKNKTAT